MILHRILSLDVGIQAPSRDITEELLQLMAMVPRTPGDTPPALTYNIEEAEDGFLVRRDGILTGSGLRREDIFETIQDDLLLYFIQSRDFSLIHSAVLAKGEKILLLPGATGSGKTTLSAMLIKHGYTYISDEFAPLSFDLAVRPYTLPLRLREGALQRLPSLSPELSIRPTPFLGQQEKVFYALPACKYIPDITVPGTISLIIFPQFARISGAEAGRLRPGIAAMRLMALTLNMDSIGECGFSAVTELVQDTPCYKLLVGDAEKACRIIDSL